MGAKHFPFTIAERDGITNFPLGMIYDGEKVKTGRSYLKTIKKTQKWRFRSILGLTRPSELCETQIFRL